MRYRKQFSVPDFMSSSIPYPELSEQERIGALLNSFEFRLQRETKDLNLLLRPLNIPLSGWQIVCDAVMHEPYRHPIPID